MTNLLLVFLLVATSLFDGPSAADEANPQPTVDPSFRCAVNAYPPPPNDRLHHTWFVLDLDAPPEKRWGHIVKRFLVPIKGLMKHLKQFVHIQISKHLGSNFPVDFFFRLMRQALPSTMRREIEGMAAASSEVGVDFNSFLGFNLIYELKWACTSILARGVDGRLVHGRNVDFGIGLGVDPTTHQFIVAEYLRKLAVNLEFRRGGKLLYRANTFVGYLPILSGVKKGNFSMSVNMRAGKGHGIMSVFSWVLGMKKGVPMAEVTRHLFEELESFEDARKYLESVTVLSPVYMILGGVSGDEGVVITRSDNRSILPQTLSSNVSWLLQTNSDHWSPQLPWDNKRTPGYFCMKGVAGHADFAGLYNVLSTKPVLNLETTYTALMNVSSGSIETYVRRCAYPCQPGNVTV